MRSHLVTLLTIFLLAALPAAAQSILPTSFAGWTQNAKQPFIAGDPAAPANATAVAQEYGLVSGESAVYTQGQDTLNVMLYRTKDPSGAYGEYSYLRTQDMPRAELAERSAMSADRALMLDGNLLLDVRGHDLPKLQADLKSLVVAVAPQAQTGLLPNLTDHLPRKNFVDRSDHYVLGPAALNQFFPVPIGNSLGFSQGAEAELAHYRLAGHDVTLLIADYPTPQTAAKKLAELQQQFDIFTVSESKGNASESKTNSRQDDNATPLYAKRSLTMLALVAGASSQNEANALLKQIDSGTELTWNEPTFALTQPNIGTMIVGTIIGTGLICVFALISGLAFGGVRLVVKRTLPDKVFDRSDQLQILQLGLCSKPINAEDFYGLGSTSKN